MKIFRYWVRQPVEIEVDGEKRIIICIGGSNESNQAAVQNALEQAEYVRRRIIGTFRPEASYTASIREEFVEQLSSDVIVTRNRYGALVMNSSALMFIDIDHPHMELKHKFCRFFRKTLNEKKMIVQQIEALAQDRYSQFHFRVYETAAGIRVMVTNWPAEPGASATQDLFEACHADPLYAMLCARQRCYRARLTPKPYRIHVKGFHRSWPVSEDVIPQLSLWQKEYEAASQRYAVCRFIKNINGRFSSPEIEYHDKLTHAYSNLPLA